MSKIKRFITKLSAEEKLSLENGYKNGTFSIFRRKCQCILQSYEGYTVNELSDFYKVGIRTIYTWFNAWESEGIKGLNLKSGRGRKPKLKIEDPVLVQKVKEYVENEPQQLNRVVAKLEAEFAISISKKTLKRFLKNLNLVGNASEKV